jgi:hypothetical protein
MTDVALTAVCISDKMEPWKLPYHFYCYLDGWKDVDRSDPQKYIEYTSSRRNAAVEKALEAHPETTDLMMVDSYYVGQFDGIHFRDQFLEISHLASDYYLAKNSLSEPFILGAATWGKVRTRLLQYLRNKTDFYDKWADPCVRWMPRGWRPENDGLAARFTVPVKGFYRVHSVGGCYIFSRRLWDRGVRYGVPDDLHGCEHNYLCETSGAKVFLDLNAELWREKRYSFVKCLRCTLGEQRRRIFK